MFQSRSLRSSPGVYLRCSLNSTEKPWNGLACRPARKPSTMNLARRSSRATWRMTSGRRYFSGLLMEQSANPSEPGTRALRLRFRLGLFHQQQAVGLEEAFAVHLVDAVGLAGQELAQAAAQFLNQVRVFGGGAVHPAQSEQLGGRDHVPH